MKHQLAAIAALTLAAATVMNLPVRGAGSPAAPTAAPSALSSGASASVDDEGSPPPTPRKRHRGTTDDGFGGLFGELGSPVNPAADFAFDAAAAALPLTLDGSSVTPPDNDGTFPFIPTEAADLAAGGHGGSTGANPSPAGSTDPAESQFNPNPAGGGGSGGGGGGGPVSGYPPGQTGNNPSGVPEPAAWAMLLAGFGGVGGVLRLARRKDGAVAA